MAQDLGERLYFDGQLYHYECIMSETLGNAFLSLMDLQVVENPNLGSSNLGSSNLVESEFSGVRI